MVYWDDYWDGSQGVTHHHLLLFLRKHFHLDSLCEELMVEKIFHSESADKRGQLQLMHTRDRPIATTLLTHHIIHYHVQ